MLFPVVERELRVAARRRSTHRIRILVLLAVTVVFAWVIFVTKETGLANPMAGRQFFVFLTYPAAFFSLLIGVFSTADCIAVEKREGTLGLLFLTDLKGYDVVFGKLVATSLNGFYALIAVLPALGIPLVLGGVTFSEYLELILALISTMFFSLSAGVFVSCVQENERKAMFLTCAFLLGISILPLVYGGGPTGLALASPFSPIICAIAGDPATWPLSAYWKSLAVTWFMTLLLLVQATLLVPKSQQDRPVSAPPKSVSRQRRRPSNRRSLAVNPFAWLAARGEADPRLVWLFLVCVGAMWLLFCLIIPGNMGAKLLFDEPVVVWGDLTINTVLKIWIISETSRRFAEDRRTGAFELLLSTPLNELQIVRGQWLALWKQFGLPLLAVLAWDIFLAIGIHRHDPEFGYKHLVATIFLAVDAPVLGSTGMWLGLLTGNRNRAILFGILLVLTMPWLAGIGLFEGVTSFTLPITVSAQGWSAEIAGLRALADLTAWGIADGLLVAWMGWAIRHNFRRIVTEGSSRL